MRRRGKLTCGGVLFLALALAGVAEAGINLGGTGLGSGSSETLTSSKFSIGSALRYLSKAIFIDALAGTTDSQVETIESHLRSSNVQDSSDCVKKLICELHGAEDYDQLNWDEKLILNAVSNDIDYASPFVQFQLAADLGTQRPDQCRVVYSRCAFSKADILSLMRQRGTSLDIKTDEEYQCTVLFLWNKKLNIPDKKQDEDEEYTDEEN